ncbi:MAG TPA: SMC family ATPase, partial [Anaerolineales bacterium]|nr:SMC family ATPase [Anaerolineales bacterium]
MTGVYKSLNLADNEEYMIPLHLSIAGFLSYRDPVEIDLSAIELACIAGANGAGKSSLLDAITWVLFGQARKRDDSIINSQSDMASVGLIFSYEGNCYRVLRSKPRDKTTVLEFHILQSGQPLPGDGAQTVWKPLTERSLRETEQIIQNTLRLDYETFVNASFFLQGKADQFTQQRPGDRKRILSSILGLDIWEQYRLQAVERRKHVEAEISIQSGRLDEISAELAEEANRRAQLKAMETNLEQASKERMLQEQALHSIREVAAALENQTRLVDNLQQQLAVAERRRMDLAGRLESRRRERDEFAELNARSEAIQAAYQRLQEAREELERLNDVASRFREQEKRREGPRDEIKAAQARLLQEAQSLEGQLRQIDVLMAEAVRLESQQKEAAQAVAMAEEQVHQREALELALQGSQQLRAESQAEKSRLRAEMTPIKERIEKLAETEGAQCPVCGKDLAFHERDKLIEELTTQGKTLGEQFRLLTTTLTGLDEEMKNQEARLTALRQIESQLHAQHQRLAQVNSRLEVVQGQIQTWQDSGAPRLREIRQALDEESYAAEARQRLAEVDEELWGIGYDAAAHDAIRREVGEGRKAEEDSRALERARAALAPLEREIAELETEAAVQDEQLDRQREETTSAAAALAEAQSKAPDLRAAERVMYDLQERENQVRLEVGAARQKVLVLDDLKQRRKTLEEKRKELRLSESRFRQLEKSFGKDGVPALLIEQSLPEIEGRANAVLERLSSGTMTVRFITQAQYRDKKRDDLRETLD